MFAGICSTLSSALEHLGLHLSRLVRCKCTCECCSTIYNKLSSGKFKKASSSDFSSINEN